MYQDDYNRMVLSEWVDVAPASYGSVDGLHDTSLDRPLMLYAGGSYSFNFFSADNAFVNVSLNISVPPESHMYFHGLPTPAPLNHQRQSDESTLNVPLLNESSSGNFSTTASRISPSPPVDPFEDVLNYTDLNPFLHGLKDNVINTNGQLEKANNPSYVPRSNVPSDALVPSLNTEVQGILTSDFSRPPMSAMEASQRPSRRGRRGRKPTCFDFGTPPTRMETRSSSRRKEDASNSK